MFLQITEGLWSRCTPHCQGLRQAHAICQIDGKVAEWGWDTLCWSTLLSFMCHIWMSCESHTFVICCWHPPETLASAAHTHTSTDRREKWSSVITLTCGHQSLNATIILIPSQWSLVSFHFSKAQEITVMWVFLCLTSGKDLIVHEPRRL